MGKVICFMGKSSTGKDTVFQKLLEDKELNLKKIIPYTTRPIRDGEVNGIEYFFTDESGYRKMLQEGRIIEERTYHTYHGLWRYFTVDDGRIDILSQNYAIIGTIEAYVQMSKFFGKENVLPILIEVDDGVRLQRALDREKAQDNPRYEEMCRRYLADCEDFSEDKIKLTGINHIFLNENLESCLQEIKVYIKDFLKGTENGY